MNDSQNPSICDIDSLFHKCEGAYARTTLRSYREDLRQFNAWCRTRGKIWLPAEPATISEFIDEQVPNKKISTIKRKLCAVKFAHRLRDLDCPTEHSSVHLAIRRAARAKPRRPTQSLGLTAELLKQIVGSCPDSLSGRRDAALISVGYDTLCRSSELAAMRMEHVGCDQQGQKTVLIPTSKGDAEGDGRIAYFSPVTNFLMDQWLKTSKLETGPVFRGLHTGKISNRELDTSSIRRLVKAAAWRANLDRETVTRLSGHSMRIGAAQDMLHAGFDALAIMQAGGWKTPAVVLRYVENASTHLLHERRWHYLSKCTDGLL